MNFYDKDKLRGILDSTDNPDVWAEQIDKLTPPKFKYFDVAHNRYHLKQAFTHILYSQMEECEDPSKLKNMLVEFVAESIQYFSGRKWGYGLGIHGHNKTLDDLAIECLKKFARDLGVSHLVSATKTETQTFIG